MVGHVAGGIIMEMQYPYQVFSPTGQPLMEAPESCRYSPRIEKSILEAGYTIRLHGKKITKSEVCKADKG